MSNAYANSFSANGLATASNSKILIMCFDRLDRDLAVARSAIERKDFYTTNESLVHAEDLLGEVAGMLDVDAWRPASTLLAVYDYILRLLPRANTLKTDAPKSIELVAEAQRLLTEIGDAFRVAAGSVPATSAPSLSNEQGGPGLSIRA